MCKLWKRFLPLCFTANLTFLYRTFVTILRFSGKTLQRLNACICFIFHLNRENSSVNKCICLNTTQFAFPGGRRGNLTLQHILQFTTGGDEEPIWGYKIPPSIIFVHPVKKSFLPSANTCINCLKLLRGSINIPLPSEQVLHNLYDYAFSNAYFGSP